MKRDLAIWLLLCSALLSCQERRDREFEVYERLASEENWTALAEIARGNYIEHGGKLDANWFHLAQAHRGRLVEELFKTRQIGPSGLLFFLENSELDPLYAYVFFAMGNYASAQYCASNALFLGNEPDYAMLKLLVRCELMRGNEKVADKYIRMLRKKRKFVDWVEHAKEDTLIEMGGKNCFDEVFLSEKSFYANLFRAIEANPSNNLAMQYCLSSALLAKDIFSVFRIVDRHFGTPALEELPTPVQEALLVLWDWQRESGETLCPIDLDYCFSHGVSEQTFERFGQFKAAMLSGNEMRLIPFSGTYWHYDSFAEI